MAQITITLGTRAINGVAGQYNYQATIPAPNPIDPPIPNPETKQLFVERIVRKFVKDSAVAFEATQGGKVGRDTALADAETNIVVT